MVGESCSDQGGGSGRRGGECGDDKIKEAVNNKKKGELRKFVLEKGWGRA